MKKVIPTRWSDINKESTERRDIVTVYAGDSSHGKSTVYIKCPFCCEETRAYIWSLNGSGKRCENDSCKAILGRCNAYKVAQ